MNSKNSNKKKLNLTNIVKLFIRLNEEFKINGSNSVFFNFLSLFFYFAHLMSYIIFYDLQSEIDQHFQIFANIIYYTNYANIIIYADNITLYMIIYVMTVGSIFFISLYVPALIFGKTIWKIDLSNQKLFSILNYLFIFLLNAFFWCLLNPSLDLLLKAAFCDGDNSLLLKNKTICFGNKFLIVIFSTITTILLILIEFLNLLVNENYFFLDKWSLNLNVFRIWQLFLFGLRVLINIICIFFNDSKIFIHIGIHIFFIMSLIDYMRYLPFRNPYYNKFYLVLVCYFECMAIFFSSSEYILFIGRKNFLFSFLTLALILCKLSDKIFERENNFDYFSLGAENLKNKDYLLEEISYLFERQNSSEKFYFILVGLLRKISKIKKNKYLEIKNSICNNEFHQLSLKDRGNILNNYVKEDFQDLISFKSKSGEKKSLIEKTILKYISFLLKGHASLIKIFFEYLKIKSMVADSSILFQLKSEILFERIVFKIEKIHGEIKRSNKQLSEDETNILASDFFFLEKKKQILQKQLNETINSKIGFFEKLNNGFDNYDEMISKLNFTVKKMNSFKNHLDKDSQNNIITLEFYSIFNSIILNFVPLALKNEEEIENIKKKYYKYEEKKLTPNMFFSSSVIFQISFLNEGKILESSKTENIANFFGFNRAEFNSRNNINFLMPNFIAKKHRKIIENSLEKSRKACYRDNISVLAINKENFCFPVQIFFSNCFECNNDFVLNALIRKKLSLHRHIILSDSTCAISNVSEETFNFLNYHMVNLTSSDLNFFKIYQLIPETNKFLQEEHFIEKSFKVLNVEGSILIPQSIDEIIELLRIKSQILSSLNHGNLKDSDSIQSSRSLRTFQSESKRRNCSHLLNNFISKNSFLTKKLEGLLINWMNDNDLKISDLLDNFYHCLEIRKFRISFDLEIKTIFLDELQTRKNSLQYIELFISKLDEHIKDGSAISDEKINFVVPKFFSINRLAIKATESASDANLETSKFLIEKEIINDIIDTNQTKKKNTYSIKKKNSDESLHDDYNNDQNRKGKIQSSNRESSVGIGAQKMNFIEVQKKLMSSYPFPVNLIYLLFLFQLMLVLLFALLIFFLSFNYLENFYYPLHEALNEQTTLNLSFRYAGIVIIQNELEFQGFIKRDNFTKNKQSEILHNFSLSAKITLEKFRDKDRNFLFEKHLKSSITKYHDLRAEKIRNVTFSDLMDLLLDNMNDVSARNLTNDNKTRKFYGRNIPYYLETSKINRDLVQSEFLDSKTVISSHLTNVLVIFCVLAFVIKVVEFLTYLKLQKKIVQIMNILLRITNHEAKKEFAFLKEVFEKSKSSNFLSFSFTEHLSKKDEIYKIYEGQKKLTFLEYDKLNNSKKKKVRNMNMRPFSKKSLCLYLTLSLALIYLYYIANYTFLLDIQEKINSLISLNIMASNLNLYTGNIVGLTLFQMRDKLLMEKEYEKLNEDLQKIDFRQKFFYSRFTSRIIDLKFYIHSIPGQFTDAKANMNKDFDELVNGNLCEILLNKSEIDSDYYIFCRKALNGGFNSGLIGALNEYLNFVNQAEEYLKARNNTDASAILKDNQKILKFFSGSDYRNIILESVLLLKALRMFLLTMKDYYNGILTENVKNLEIINFISCLVAIAIFSVFASFWIKQIRSSYKNSIWGLTLIPYEKIVNDDQTIFLIKKFHKEI